MAALEVDTHYGMTLHWEPYLGSGSKSSGISQCRISTLTSSALAYIIDLTGNKMAPEAWPTLLNLLIDNSNVLSDHKSGLVYW